jgi:hypothetical protein
MFEKSFCSWVKLGPDEENERIHRPKGGERDVGELTGGDFVAEA